MLDKVITRLLFSPETNKDKIKSKLILKQFNLVLKKFAGLNFVSKQKIFISYAWASQVYSDFDYDRYKRYEVYIEKFAEHLELLGFSVYLDKWYDKGNQDFQAKLLEEIHSSDKFVIFVSPLYLHKFNLRSDNKNKSEHVVRVEGLLMNHAVFLNKLNQETLYPVFLENTERDIRFLPSVNRGYLSNLMGGLEICDYFEDFAFDIIRDLLCITRDQKDKMNDINKAKQDFYAILKAISKLPEDKLQEQVNKLERKEGRRKKRAEEEAARLLLGIVSDSSEGEDSPSPAAKKIPLQAVSSYQPKIIALNCESFVDMIEKKGYVFDRTQMIFDFIETPPGGTFYKLQLITRPRRFGKTLNMTMLYEFLSDTINGQKNPHKSIFSRFQIGKNQEFFEEHFAKYKVIHFTMKDINGSTPESIFTGLLGKMSEQFIKFEEVENNLSRYEHAYSYEDEQHYYDDERCLA